MKCADAVVCSSLCLAKNVEPNYKGQIELVEDAVEVLVTPPKTKTNRPVTLLWFGHGSNLKYLIDFLPKLGGNNLRLIVLCNIEGFNYLKSTPLNIPPNVQTEGAVWSVPAMIEAAKHCDLCIIPSDPNDPRKAGVSSNRLLTALALGLPTAADMMDSYKPYAQFFTDIRGPEFSQLLQDPTQFHDRVLAAQAGPVIEHSMEKIGSKWVDLINRTMAAT